MAAASADEAAVRRDLAAAYRLAARRGWDDIVCVSDEVAERTQRQWLGDGRTPEGEDEWPALLRSLDD